MFYSLTLNKKGVLIRLLPEAEKYACAQKHNSYPYAGITRIRFYGYDLSP
jgi:hypothetical protein